MRKVFFYSNSILICVWVGIFFIFQFSSYGYFTDQIIKLLHIEDSSQGILISILNPGVFLKLKWLFLALAIFQTGVLILVNKKPMILQQIKKCLLSIIEYPKWLWVNFNSLNKIEKILFGSFLTVVIIQRLWLSNITDVIYDEAWTYLAFTSKNPMLAACFYPTSNNHVFFSLLTQLTKFLPFDILTNLRMAALIPNILAIVTLFFCLRKFVKPLAAWCGIILFAFSFPMVYYGFVARGYSLMVLFFIIGFFSVIAIMQNPDNKNAWFRLMISSVLGFYTIPVYLYPFVSMMGFVFIYFLKKKDLASILRTLKFGLATCILTLAVYTPIFAINGIGSVTNNKFVTPLSLNEVALGFKQHLNQTIQFFTLSDYGYLLIILVIVLVILIFKNIKSKSAFYLSVFIIIITPAFIFIHKVLPVERTWIYLMVVFIFLICVLINNLKWPVLAIVFSFIYSVIVQVGWNKQMLWYDAICKEDYLQGKHFSDYFHNKKVSIVTTSRMNTYLKFNKLLQNENWQIETDSIEVSDTCYYIHYKEKDKYPPTSFKKIGTNGNYELYLVNIE